MENSTDVDIGIVVAETSGSKTAKHGEELTVTDPGNSSGIVGSTSASLNSVYVHGSNSDMSYHGDDNNGEDNGGDDNDGDDVVDDDCYISDYDDNDDYMFDNDDNDDDDEDDYLNMQAQFDNVDLPPGVEASVSWMKNTTSSLNVSSSNKDAVFLPSGSASVTETSVATLPAIQNSNNNVTASSSSMMHVGSSSDEQKEAEKEHNVMKSYEWFKRFDTVNDFSDHHYSGVGFQGQQPPRTWTKKIHDEWKMLEKGLPETIYVRVCETRMDLLRAIIVGPAGTPYHDGLFVFDVLFPPTYPDIPPMVYYYSGGLRLNPNLYDCGKVCLSLLNTWNGNGNEKWIPQSSTMLQVLVSIQALILNAKPFFNEPGYDGMYPGDEGERRSKEYNENTFILSLKTMMYTLRRPPKHYEDFVAGHFRTNGRRILLACRAYMNGAEVGSLVDNDDNNDSRKKVGSSPEFKSAVAKMMNGLVSNFSRNGSNDCEEFRLP